MLKAQHTTAPRLTPASEVWDALIVGAGPAGMFAALSLAAAGLRRTLLIDAGPDVHERRLPTKARTHASYERGVGGAGLFSDGKLCLSLDVGGHLEEALDDDRRDRLLGDVRDVFASLIEDIAPRKADMQALASADRAAAKAGLGFKYYPVAHIGTDRCHEVIVDLRDAVERGGTTIMANAELTELRIGEGGDKTAIVRTPSAGREGVHAKHVVLAMGKVGAARQAELCARLGITLKPQPIYAGVRFEAPAGAVAPLFSVTKDPKYNLRLSTGDKVKTHCASENGEVLTLRYSDLPLAGGHNYFHAKTGRSGFSILWDGFDGEPDSYEFALGLMRRTHERTGGKLLVQRMADYRAGRASTPRSVAGIPLTCEDSVPGDVRDVLPADYFPRMDAFLDRMEALTPGLVDRQAVIYAPAIEWWMKQIDVGGAQMETAVPGLHVCGDGSGWSQGIVHAAATGLLAAEGIHATKVDLGGWVARLVSHRRRSAA
ncbi:MAG TPA: FAD-dependent oxidoreductase [Thermoleophilaceae bacterium]|nr:FAD-dependent oxidoreductase [Thermoleophilaceae bacterium]